MHSKITEDVTEHVTEFYFGLRVMGELARAKGTGGGSSDGAKRNENCDGAKRIG